MLWWTLRQLKSRDSNARRRAAEKLAEYEDARALLALTSTLRDREIEVRKAVIEALAKIATAPAIVAVLEALESDVSQTRFDAINALKVNCARWSNSASRTQVVRALTEVLKDGDAVVWKSASDLLIQIDRREAIQSLVATLKEGSSRGRERAAQTLGEIGDPLALEPLTAALKDAPADVRSAAAAALASLGDAQALESLVAALSDSDHNVRWKVAEIINNNIDQWRSVPVASAIVPDFIALLENENWYVRESAAKALGVIADGRAFTALTLALRDDNEYVRQAAVIALEAFGELPVDDGQKALLALAHRDWRGLVNIGRAAVEPLLAALKDPTWEARAEALRTLGQIGDARAFEALMTGMRDAYGKVRSVSAEALGNVGDQRAVTPLIAALADVQEPTREAAAEALGKLADAQSVAPLVGLLADKNQKVAHLAAESLVKIGGPAVEPLLKLLDEKSANLRRIAAKLLGRVADRRAIECLTASLGDEDGSVRTNAEEALAQIAPDWEKTEAARAAVPVLIAALTNSQTDVRKNTIRILGKIGDAPATEPLVSMIKDEDSAVRQMAAEALATLGWQPENIAETVWYALARNDGDELLRLGSEALDFVIEALAHKDMALAAMAASLLGKMKDARAVEPLIAAFNRGDDSVQLNSAMALGDITDCRAVEPLVARLPRLSEATLDAAAHALLKISVPRPVSLLVAVINNQGFHSEGGVRALQRVLEIMAHIIPAEDLYAASRLDNFDVSRTAYAECGMPYNQKETIDCLQIRQFARQELIRRGLEA